MRKPRKPERRTRIILLDGEVFLVKWYRRDIREVRRLTGPTRERALRMLDDTHAEIEALVEGFSG